MGTKLHVLASVCFCRCQRTPHSIFLIKEAKRVELAEPWSETKGRERASEPARRSLTPSNATCLLSRLERCIPLKATEFKSGVAPSENGIKGWTINLSYSPVTGHLRAKILMGPFSPLLFPGNGCMIHGLSFTGLHFHLITFPLLLLSGSFVSPPCDTGIRTGTPFMTHFTTEKAAIFRAFARMLRESTAIANTAVAPGRLDTLFTEKAMAPLPAILGCARITVFTVLIL